MRAACLQMDAFPLTPWYCTGCRRTASGDKFLKEVNVQVLDQEVRQTSFLDAISHRSVTSVCDVQGEVVADVQKVLYFRLKRQYRPPSSSGEKHE